jgi:pyroglutamyl-peptidase
MTTILVTGFGAFPGVKDNPSAALMSALEARRDHFARLGIRVEPRILPVVYEGLAARLSALVDETKPDAILHFGVAARRKTISAETWARNRVNGRAADAQGARPMSKIIDPEGADKRAVRIPAAQIAAKIRSAGIAARTSRDAGDYLCNATLYQTLGAQPHLPAGFIHIPMPAERRGETQPCFDDIIAAAGIAIIAVAEDARQDIARHSSVAMQRA